MPTTPSSYADLSLWHATLGEPLVPRASLPGSGEADVVVVGAGLTGLWTAYYLVRADPTLRVVVLEQEIAGFGASGRNGGWCSALFPTSWDALVAAGGHDGALRQHRAMQETVREVGRVAAAEGIGADYVRGGTVTLARSAVQLERLREAVGTAHARGFTEDDERLLDAGEARSLLDADGVLGGTFTPHTAAVHPARLVRGLARVVEAAGVRVHERTRATRIAPGRVETDHGTVRAAHVVRATEGWTDRLAPRAVVPVYSLMVATEPLDEAAWARIGLHDRPTFTDGRHRIIYGQRTADGRLAFGGRGAPYHFGSRVHPSYDAEPRVFDDLERTLRELLPQLGDAATGVRFTHRWGGPLAIARDWAASVGLDRATGLAWAGGYVGDGVSTTNLAGRTLADLITGTASDLVDLPWVQHRSRRWEPEPLRWLGINAGLMAMTLADAEEERTGRSSRLARLMAPLTGGH
ncbi:NAD(P)/FAD-dependent oxidoreductase [Nocardioides aurantiacus]|uniref:Glycine/D-amino acid oxidase-like deaminating enzyme n=1 Tax=Nocardioides aurantiacus TaxID=86796 RepID=A0A3N2CV65_9ACTN|nr:FAD-dependent oxidoreductase [Nocardioides aurantiacus]ROR91308.1 glycine/D-amino acid oxidase-like deaminating enzyme [Nocardioides aurantiacus]